MKNVVQKGLVAVAGLTASSLALAQEAPDSNIDFSSLTAYVSTESVISGVLAIAGAMIVVHLAIRGAKMVASMVKGG